MFENERAFVQTAQAEMTSLIAHVRAADAFDDLSLRQSLVTIWASAKTVSAGGVAMASKTCQQVLDGSPATIADELPYGLKTLERLISQYAHGLREVDPDAHESVQGPMIVEPRAPQAALMQTDDAPLDSGNAAASVLSKLIRFAEPSDQSALTRLLELSGASHDEAGDGDGIIHIPGNQAAPARGRPSVLVESVMGPVINSVLSYAHRSQKSVSLSYSLPELWIDPARAALLEKDLSRLCALIADMTADTAPQIKATAPTLHVSISLVSCDYAAGDLAFEISDNGRLMDVAEFNETVAMLGGLIDSKVQILPRRETGQDLGGNRVMLSLSAQERRAADDSNHTQQAVETALMVDMDLAGASA